MKRRHKRIAFILAGLLALSIATLLVAGALRNNLVFFFSPTEVAAKQAPVNRTFRIGGLVEEGTLRREGEMIRFTVTDTAASIPVVYKGASLPDLFKPGKGCVVEGRLGDDGVFYAQTVLAKHDENYMPPEAGDAVDKAKHAKEAAKTVTSN